MAYKSTNNKQPPWLTAGEKVIFSSRWLQAPLYAGLIIAQAVYVYKFVIELWHLIVGLNVLNETAVMLIVLTLVDVVMISNLLMMVIVGGYETFVSRLYIDDHPDKPEWLNHVDAGVLKVKLATALIGISSIHLLKTFINAGALASELIFWQVIIHIVFLFSALALVYVNRLLK